MSTVVRFLRRRPDIPLVAAVAVAAHLFLFLSYRHGFPMFDAPYYVWSATSFIHWEPSVVDWARMPTVGLLLLLGQGTAYPGLPIFFVSALLFTANIVLFSCLTYAIFRSSVSACLAALLLLFLELSIGWTFFAGTWMISDALYADLLFLGELLFLIAALEKRSRFLIVGSLAFGIAVATRPGSFVIFLLWLPALFLIARHVRMRAAPLCLSTLLFCGFLAFWGFHQWSLYRVIGTQAFGERLLFARTLTFAGEDDRVFSDPDLNRAFTQKLHEERRLHGNDFGWYLSGQNGESALITMLAPLTDDGKLPPEPESVRRYVRGFFQLRPILKRAAFRIIVLHPFTYVRGVVRRYALLFNPYQDPRPFIRPFMDPQNAYDWMSGTTPHELILPFYPPTGIASATPRAPFFSDVFPGTHVLPFIIPFLSAHRFLPAIITHLFFAVFFGIAWFRRRARSLQFRLASFCASLFLLTGTLSFLTIAAVHEPFERYSMAGEMSLFAAAILCICAALRERHMRRKGLPMA